MIKQKKHECMFMIITLKNIYETMKYIRLFYKGKLTVFIPNQRNKIHKMVNFKLTYIYDQDTSRGVCLMEHTSFEISFVKYN